MYFVGLLEPIAPYIEFEINKGYIQEVLCINKNEPITVCGGKCYLSKQLKKVAEKSKQPTSGSFKINLNTYPIGFVQILNFEFKAFTSSQDAQCLYIENYSFQPQYQVFHPPMFS
ncbi:hypothetical protein LVD15_19485 [Fulvivirga maritima]|uniref:hypothetical protein n=1 Tax=Fulvivirga maritima TaxID=2904247 RepID=UPI001F3A54E7|nr:hypothetical protein [Fulvivirga maritima]UII25468.1 hypothetical protein LVD15_19485 [Fulvivirga maritima]